MNRHYNITYKNHVKNSSNKINLDLLQLDSIINHSADSIYCSCLNYINEENCEKTISTILNKVKPQGIVTFSMLDIKYLAKNFLESKISGTEFLTIIANCESVMSAEDIFTKLDTNTFQIVQIVSNNGYLEVTIARLKI